MGPTIRVEQLTLFRGGQRVLDEASLHVSAGEAVCLLGPSGSGKSSLLRCVNRLTEPPAGAIFLGEVDIHDLDVLALRRRVGMVFQHVALFPGTVGANVAYGAQLEKQLMLPEQVARLLAMADLTPELAAQASQALSGGQAQRVAIARALATEPEALLLDEPTSALDPSATRHVEETMLKLRRELGLTILWVTHDAAQAQRVADRVYLLVDGRIIDEGNPAHLFRPGSLHPVVAFAAGEMSSHRGES